MKNIDTSSPGIKNIIYLIINDKHFYSLHIPDQQK